MIAHPLADVGLLVEAGDLDTVLGLDAALRQARGSAAFADVIDVVPAAETITLLTRPGADLAAIERAVAALRPAPPAADAEGEAVRIDVAYDGEDLDDVARACGTSPAEVVAAHTGTTWRAAFGGFAPGFFYLVPVGEPPFPQIARRAEPRTRVPAGAVGLAGPFSAVYPRASPGGWQLLGRTDAALWDVTADPPALLRPGALVRFVDKEAGS